MVRVKIINNKFYFAGTTISSHTSSILENIFVNKKYLEK